MLHYILYCRLHSMLHYILYCRLHCMLHCIVYRVSYVRCCVLDPVLRTVKHATQHAAQMAKAASNFQVASLASPCVALCLREDRGMDATCSLHSLWENENERLPLAFDSMKASLS